MTQARSRVRLRNRFVQGRQKSRVILMAFVGAVWTSFLFHERAPRYQGEAAEFVRCEFLQFSFDFSKAHLTATLRGSAGKDNIMFAKAGGQRAKGKGQRARSKAQDEH